MSKSTKLKTNAEYYATAMLLGCSYLSRTHVFRKGRLGQGGPYLDPDTLEVLSETYAGVEGRYQQFRDKWSSSDET